MNDIFDLIPKDKGDDSNINELEKISIYEADGTICHAAPDIAVKKGSAGRTGMSLPAIPTLLILTHENICLPRSLKMNDM